MAHLKSLGTVVYMRLPFEEIESRIRNLATRGVAMKPGMTLRDTYNERLPLYEKYADVTIDCTGSPGAQRRPDRKSVSRQLICMTQGQDIPAGSPDLVKCQSL